MAKEQCTCRSIAFFPPEMKITYLLVIITFTTILIGKAIM